MIWHFFPIPLQTKFMRARSFLLAIGMALAVGWAANQGLAGVLSSKELLEATAPTDFFQEGSMEAEIHSGVLFELFDHPAFNEAPAIFRFGWMLSTPQGDAFYRGNWEVLLDLYGSGIFHGPGNVVIGPEALIRYNFVQPGWWVVPYLQIGAGIVYTDAWEDHTQRLIGGPVEFTPQASGGLRFMVDPQWSIQLECMYHHISNAGLYSRNVGVNQVGALLGVSYLFR
ncbi:putative Outer membrane protein W [Candidatus Methylacidithermus pantelleriae]|uniref:Putative Outer membrane protein W n=2 Tax=Candidatus Methylacidithermus pantelleriae TaxID=2744239 RepID=A0A8J2BJW1_9BACT|nr:putative Outer membrane protein W [Candidatus Methylacidithermus pantelleriae]